MPKVMISPSNWKEILRERRALGHDRKDEVWDGVYFMAPPVTNSHQFHIMHLHGVLEDVAPCGSIVQAGGNISDRQTDWKENYRCPDLMVFLPGNPAQDLETHYLGGPDFLVEVVRPGDRSRRKLPFYASVGTREVLLVDQHKSRISLYQQAGEGWAEPLVALVDDGTWLTSSLLPLAFSFQTVPHDKRPHVVVRHTEDGREWNG